MVVGWEPLAPYAPQWLDTFAGVRQKKYSKLDLFYSSWQLKYSAAPPRGGCKLFFGGVMLLASYFLFLTTKE